MNEDLQRALEYPYARPERDFVFRGGGVLDWDEAPDLQGRTAVLAIGSNAAPLQLRRKFGDDPRQIIPVSRLTLAGHDVAYSAYITHYGSIPATLIASPDTEVSIFVTWLDAQQLAIMHSTEAVGTHTDYGVIALPGAMTAGRCIEAPGLYTSRLAVLALDDRPVTLREISAKARRFPDRSQHELQHRVHADCGSTLSLHAWIRAHIQEPEARAATTAWLQERAATSALANFVRTD